MPIKGLSERIRFARGGHLRLGEQVECGNGRHRPKKLDYFLADFDNPEATVQFAELYGEKPTMVRIAFPSESVEEFFPQYYTLYGQTGLKCKGDGETCERFDQDGMHEFPCPSPEDCDFCGRTPAGKPLCKRLARLQFFICGMKGMSVYQINTTSYNSILNVNSGIRMLESIRAVQGKGIAGVPVILRLVETEVQHDGKKDTAYCLKIELPFCLEDVANVRSHFELPLPVGGLLPAPDESKDKLLYPDDMTPPKAATAPPPAVEHKQATVMPPAASRPAPPPTTPRLGELKAACNEARRGTDLAPGAAYAGWLKKHFGRGSTELTEDELEAIPAMIAEHVAKAATPQTAPAPAKTDETPAHTARAIQLLTDYGIEGGWDMDVKIEELYGPGHSLEKLTADDVKLLALKLKRDAQKQPPTTTDPDGGVV